MKLQMDLDVSHKQLSPEEIQEIIKKGKEIELQKLEEQNPNITYIQTDNEGVPIND